MSAVGAVPSTVKLSLASPLRAFVAVSVMLEPAAVSVKTYAPSVPVTDDRSIVYWLAVTVVTVRPLIETPTASRVSEKSSIVTQVTSSLKLIVTTPAFVLRGSAVTSTTSAVGAVRSTVNASIASAPSVLAVRS
jgi:hypothetical protein